MRIHQLVFTLLLVIALSGCVWQEYTARSASNSDLLLLEDNTLLVAGGEGVLRLSDFPSDADEVEEFRMDVLSPRILPAADGGYWVVGRVCDEDRVDLSSGGFHVCRIEVLRTDENFRVLSRLDLGSGDADFVMDLDETPTGDLLILRGASQVLYNEEGSITDLLIAPTTLLRVFEASGGAYDHKMVTTLADGALGWWGMQADGDGGVWLVGIVHTDTNYFYGYYEDYHAMHVDRHGGVQSEVLAVSPHTFGGFGITSTEDGKGVVVTTDSNGVNRLAVFDPATETFDAVDLDVSGTVYDVIMSREGEIVVLLRETIPFEKDTAAFTLKAFDTDGRLKWSAPIAATTNYVEFLPREDVRGTIQGPTLERLVQGPEDVWFVSGNFVWGQERILELPLGGSYTTALCVATTNRVTAQNRLTVYPDRLLHVHLERSYFWEFAVDAFLRGFNGEKAKGLGRAGL